LLLFPSSPLSPPPTTPTLLLSSLSVSHVDMCQQINRPAHHTVAFDNANLVVRRGQEFVLRVSFSRPPTPDDDFQLEFLIGSNPSANKGTMVAVTFGQRRGGGGGGWVGRVLEAQGPSLVLGVTPSPNAIVGKFRTYVAVVGRSGMHRTRRDPSTDLYVLFNAWCPEDPVFLPDEAERREYVLNEYGIIYQGAVKAVSQRTWLYGQFELGVLDACIHILDASRMPIYHRGNVIKLVRRGSAMLNSQDDNGVMVGNWSEDFSMGTAPTLWTGSVKILQEYANTGVPVCFAQCWVFAGIFNSFLRCLGIPARVITNFSSAHDNTGNLKTDLIFKTDGAPDKRSTRDSIWNYHCWNEVYMARPDLPDGMGGWQVVDATPQETSDGHFRCGPASVAAIKEGLLCHPFDAGFCFAEVNSDVVFYKRDRYGTLTPFRVDKRHVGQLVLTKAVGSDRPFDITYTYKYREGNNQRTMNRAEEYGCELDHSELPETLLSVYLGHDFNLQLEFQNQSDTPRTIQVHLAGSVVFYTGVEAHTFRDENLTVTVGANQTENVTLRITAQEYMPHLGSQLSLHFILTGQADDQSLSAIEVVNLETPPLMLRLSGRPKMQHEMSVTVSFTNHFQFALENVQMALEGPGLLSYRTHFYSVIAPQGSIDWTETFTPRIDGSKRIMATLSCSSLTQVKLFHFLNFISFPNCKCILIMNRRHLCTCLSLFSFVLNAV
uniref:protein-glutamine gamma-glutamyltransferase n=1 Tax=Myripristis murdjan TaxID=586833 RepID=A0A667YVR0_9TELE